MNEKKENMITGRKDSQRNQPENGDKRLSELFYEMLDGFLHHKILFDESNKYAGSVICDMNEAFLNMFNCKRENLDGLNIKEALPELCSKDFEWNEIIGSASSGGEAVKFEYFCEASQKYYFVTVFNSSSFHVVTLFSDITKQKRVEEMLSESQRFFKSTFNSLSSAIAIIDEKGMVVSANVSWKNMSREEAFFGFVCSTGDNFFELCENALLEFKNDAFALRGAILEIMHGKKSNFSLEHFVEIKGNCRWFNVSASLFEGQGPTRAVIIYDEITERKKAEIALRESEKYFRTLIENAPDYIRILNEDFTIRYVSPSVVKILGYAPGNIIGRNALEFVHPDDVNFVRDSLEKVLARTQSTINIEYRFGGKNGQYRFIESAIQNLLNVSSIRGIIINARDITERKKSEKILMRLNQTFLSLTSNFDENIRILTAVCAELLETSTFYTVIAGDDLVNICSFNFFAEFPKKDRAKGHICYDVINNAQIKPETTYISDLSSTGYASSDSYVNRFNWKTYVGKPIFCNAKCIGTLSAVYTNHIDPNFYNNRIVEIIAAAISIEEERKRANEKFHEMSLAIEQSANTIVITDLSGNIEYVNPMFSVTTGYTKQEAIGQNPRILKSGDMNAEDYKILWQTITSGNKWYGEFHNKRKNGELYWESAAISPIKNNEGVTTHFLAVKEDVTERKRIERELEKAVKASEAASRTKSEFLANMSHEIRTPMTSIIGMSELILDASLEGPAKKYAEYINESANLLLTIINDILDFSKIEAGKLDIENIDLDIVSAANSISEIFTLKAVEKNLNLKFLIGDEIPARVKGDPVRIRQILWNLLNNAIKFTNHGGITIEINKIKETEHMIEVKFEVKDTGIGLSEETISNLFRPFVQADGSTTRKYGGTGLGLSICKRLVELMKGEMGVISELDKGANFWFIIPFEKSNAVETSAEIFPAGDISSKEEKKALKAYSSESGGVNKENGDFLILLADDNHANQRVLLLQLKKLGVENVHLASDGREAFEMSSLSEYSLILMDCQMSVMDGYEATRKIRERESKLHVRTPIIALTADAMSGTRNKCIEAGMDDYIAKPASMKSLRQVIEKWLPQIKK